MSDTPRRSLPQIQIAEPCPADWSTMTGDDRTRFCEACGLHLHNLSDMRAPDAEELLRCRSAGRLCVRFAVAPDGTPITRDHPQAKLLDYAPSAQRSRLVAMLPFVGVAIGIATAAVAWLRPRPIVAPPVVMGAMPVVIKVPAKTPSPRQTMGRMVPTTMPAKSEDACTDH